MEGGEGFACEGSQWTQVLKTSSAVWCGDKVAFRAIRRGDVLRPGGAGGGIKILLQPKVPGLQLTA